MSGRIGGGGSFGRKAGRVREDGRGDKETLLVRVVCCMVCVVALLWVAACCVVRTVFHAVY